MPLLENSDYFKTQSRLAAPPAFGLIGETEKLPRNADQFSQWPSGWLDESSGGNAPRIMNDRPTSAAARDGYVLFEATSSGNALRYSSPPVAVDASKAHTLYTLSKRFSGTIAMEIEMICYTAGSDNGSGPNVVVKTAYDPGTTFDHEAVVINPVGGAAPAFPANTDRVVFLLKPTVGTAGSIGIKNFYFCQNDQLANTNISIGGSGVHESVYDGSHVYLSVFFAGFIAKMNPDGTFVASVPPSFVSTNDPHAFAENGNYLYAAQWTGQTVKKYDKTTRNLVSTITIGVNCLGICILNGKIFVSDANGFIHRIDEAAFTLDDSYNIGFTPSGTEATLRVAAGSVWVNSSLDGKVYRVNPSTGGVAAIINPPAGFASNRNYGMGELNGKLYLPYQNGVMAEFNPATNAVSRTWRIGLGGSSQLKSDGNSLWFTSGSMMPLLCRFNPDTDSLHTLPLRHGTAPKWCEVVDDEIWAGGFDTGRVERFARF